MPLALSLTTDIHETIIVLPGGGIHAQGLLHEGPEPAESLIEDVCSPLRTAAAQQSRTIRLSIGHPDGHVEQHQIAADGTIQPAHRPEPTANTTDPIWAQGIPEGTDLLDTVRAAHRAGQWRAAQQAAYRATQHLAAQYGRDHPYAGMGVELQAYFALMAQDHAAAATLYTESAVAIHRLGGPPSQSRHCLASAVSAWLHSDRDTRPGGTGFALAHALIRITPRDDAALAALLRRLSRERS
ncbi:hypothetical protein OG413_43820 [Streptomyces sp. NBC_01433]|uniref:hypothetical protein n=1 Tax=Streptomyces sp. NBC_01433 TaxID=2903864 RepID=UPI0022572C40|nr:hypothetical protein [Streptomyces sp. NBC_01433]MCX4682113.1 hypothetical protein [Streptomyces sp. NBC_01433]